MAEKYGMAELLAEYGYGFEKMNEEQEKQEREEQARLESLKLEEELARKKKEEEENQPKDKTLKCKKCEKEFIWTVRDQEFYKEKGFFRPSYCKDCRKKTKVVNNFHKDM